MDIDTKVYKVTVDKGLNNIAIEHVICSCIEDGISKMKQNYIGTVEILCVELVSKRVVK